MYKLTEVRDPATGKIRITVSAPITYSDRPQYVEQSSSGRLYFSTKPTRGAARHRALPRSRRARAGPALHPRLRDAGCGSELVAHRQHRQRGGTPASATSSANDALTLCDHASGTTRRRPA
jgi:hypothetical protein